MKNTSELLHHVLLDSIAIREKMMENEAYEELIHRAADVCVASLKQGGKILFCGNGGSAADAQHLAAELSGRFGFDRPPLAAEALHVNSSFMTAVANDYSFDEVYARMLHAVGKKGDVLIAISTSGNSSNILKVLDAASSLDITRIGLGGEDGGKMQEKCDTMIRVPSCVTARIQEVHIMLGHVICQLIEERIFGKAK
jgi:D-sedoheptulose 7-phosphate isomerase